MTAARQRAALELADDGLEILVRGRRGGALFSRRRARPCEVEKPVEEFLVWLQELC
jgi:hypothetical protein